MRNFLTIAVILATAVFLHGQNSLQIQVIDSLEKSPLPGASIHFENKNLGGATDENGMLKISGIPNGSSKITCTFQGFRPKTIEIYLPNALPAPFKIFLAPLPEEIEEVVVESSRTNTRIEDLPVKVEVLGLEELDEEVSLVPGGMGSLLGDLSVITIQRTGATAGNDGVRMLGLDPGYTQLLQDGLPLYEGFSGSLGVLNIPPLDLRQVEIVKGASSTLYGGGAIGGLINFISKVPTAKPQNTLLLNQTSLGESNTNAFFSRQYQGGRQGFTFLVTGNYKRAADVNDDGFAEQPRSANWLIHPKYFFKIGQKTDAQIGLTLSQTQVASGDLSAIHDNNWSDTHPFFQFETVRRGTLAGQMHHEFSKNLALSVRATASTFTRDGDYAYGFDFAGRQISTYSEASLLWKKNAHTLTAGTNFVSEDFKQTSGATVPFGAFQNTTAGVFAQHDWLFAPKWTLETGLRADKTAHYGAFLLPRISLLCRPSSSTSLRAAVGTGYKTPNLFAVPEPREYPFLQPLAGNVLPSHALGFNMDGDWHGILFDALAVQINQAFYATRLNRTLAYDYSFEGKLHAVNPQGAALSIGTDTYIRLKYDDLEWYLGYNHTLAQRNPGTGLAKVNLPFNPQDKFAGTMAYEIEGRWRFGVESAWTGNQYVENNRKVPSFWFFALMAEKKFAWGSLVLNCENVGDSRQSKYESLVSGNVFQPVFRPIWGPVEGRVVNVSVKIAW